MQKSQNKLINIVIATANKGKLKEFQDRFQKLNFENIKFLSIDQILDEPFEVEETGKTFIDNAILKAKEAAHMYKKQLHNAVLFLADDSGIEIEAFSGMPGIYSGRFLRGEPLPDEAKIQINQGLNMPLGSDPNLYHSLPSKQNSKAFELELNLGAATQYSDILFDILQKISNHKNRKCRFVCSLALADINSDIVFQTEQYWDGTIAPSPKGTHGFGYDPIVIPEGYDQTVAELGDEIKNKFSHRAQAIDELSKFLQI